MAGYTDCTGRRDHPVASGYRASIGEVYTYLTGGTFINTLSGSPADYGYRTVHAELFGGSDGYIADRATVLAEIEGFVRGYMEDKDIGDSSDIGRLWAREPDGMVSG